MTDEREPLRGLIEEAGGMLRQVRVLDCGAHYCRYCPAKSPDWEHGPSCLYEESQQQYAAAQNLRRRIEAALRASPVVPPSDAEEDLQGWQEWAYAVCQAEEPLTDAQLRERVIARTASPVVKEGERTGEEELTRVDGEC